MPECVFVCVCASIARFVFEFACLCLANVGDRFHLDFNNQRRTERKNSHIVIKLIDAPR